MKWTCLLFFVLFFAGAAIAQQNSYSKNGRKTKKAKYTMDQLIGRWQETEKLNIKTKEKIAITDTFYIRFYDNGTADTKQGNSVVITGTSEIFTGDYLTTSANDFKIISVTANELALNDLVGFRHNFSRKEIFSYEIKTAAPKAVIDTAQAVIDLSPAALIKNWYAYKREAEPGFVKPETALIRNLKILKQRDENNFDGEVEFAQFGKGFIQPCTLVFANNNVSVFTQANTWSMQVFKSDGYEMLLGKKGELLYYFQNGN